MGPALREWMLERITRILTHDLPNYEQYVANDLERLKRHIRPGDVILVDGEQRMSLVIKYLTQSAWSHVTIYVGEDLLRRHPERAAELRARFGDEADHLMIEAVMEGVVLSPLSKYLALNIRVCRPYSLRKEDRARVLDELIDRVGHTYDIKNIVDLARFYFPVSVVPRRFRRPLQRLGSGMPTSVICSSMIAEAFQNVGFPILPRIEHLEGTLPPRGWLDRWRGRAPERARRYFKEPPALVTPRDFDVSPYFEIVKFNFIEDRKLDYRKIPWADHR